MTIHIWRSRKTLLLLPLKLSTWNNLTLKNKSNENIRFSKQLQNYFHPNMLFLLSAINNRHLWKKRVDKFKWIRVKNELTLKSNFRSSLILWNCTIYFFKNQNKRCWVSQGFFSKNKKRLSWKGLKSQIADHYILINETVDLFSSLGWVCSQFFLLSGESFVSSK